MPELKRLFLKGRMNKDLDERLVPNGEYRDALNIQVGSSEGSDVGAIENILGNQVARKKRNKQLWEEDDATHNYYGLPLDAACIGAIKDDINDKIYYFVTSSEADCIIEYDKTRDYVEPVLVDTQNVLNFSSSKLITGANILDNYLFFTDDNSEPKKVNIDRVAFTTTNFVTHSQYKGRNFVESDVTVIKKSPLRAPEVSFSNSKRDGDVITTLIANFIDGGTDTGSLGTSLPLSEDDNDRIYTFNFQSEVVFLEGDIIKLSANPIAGDALYDGYEVRLEIVTVNSPVQYDTKIIGISPEVPDDDDFLWEAELEQEDPIFQFKFSRFGYRWKYEDNQFSAFSPFTEVVFLPSKFDYSGKKGFNEGMANTIRLINLFDPDLYTNATDFQNKVTDLIPDDVDKIEILYKETNNSAVYIVDEIDPDDLVYATWEGFKIESELIYKIVQSNQILRPWDNVPRKAKSQEIVGNRLVYGNYLQNYTLNTTVKLNAFSRISSAKSTNTYNTSVKSDRIYQAGVVFKDEYGRETPVFTSKNAYINIPKTSAGRANQIAVQGLDTPPQGFTHYKYFIKDLAGEYYNLAAERIYPSNDGVSTWIAFPSSERNKVSEDDYLILKKGHNSTLPVIDANNKYRILSIKNEAPTEITEKRVLEQSTSITFGATYGSYTAATTSTAGGTPVQGNTVFLIAQEDENGLGLSNGVGEELKESLKAGNYIKFTSTIGDTNYYKILRVQFTGADDAAKVYLTTAFGNDVDCLYEADGTGDLRLTENEILVYSVDNDSVNAKYQGFFFVKIEANQTLLENVFQDENFVGINSHTFLGFENLDAPDSATQQITDTTFDAPYDRTTNTFLQIWGGGVSPRRTYDKKFYNGGLDGAYAGTYPSYNELMPTWADEEGDTEWDIVPEIRLFDNEIGVVPEELPLGFWDALKTGGTKIRFSNHNTVYTIEEVREHTIPWLAPFGGNGEDFLQRLYIKFDKPLEQTVNPNFLGGDEFISISILGLAEDSDYPSNNPAVFETEPKEIADLNIYYEASDAFPIADYNNVKTLTWHNCFSFGNGVESNRIRDDFNAAFIDKGTKASAVLEDPYEEERRATGLIYSGIYNSTSGLNGLNQFIQAEKITKDINPIYGSIQKLHTRDTNLVTLCEDKCLRILANKDALFNADGNVNVTSNNNVLGQAVPFAGEFGISKNPESFASYGFRAYFSDKKRGVVLRLSMDGLTEISSKGMSDYFYDNLKAATTVLGSYDIYSDTYNLTLNNDTVCFKESSDGWPTRKSYIPEWGISLNADYYTMDNGMLWSHNNQTRNTFYEGSAAKSSVQLIFNDNPSQIKNFKTLSYEGDNGWTAPLIQTDQQDGQVTTFLDKENIYYNYIRGNADTWNNSGQSGTLDLKQFAAQGIGNPSSIAPYTGNTTFTVTVKNDPNN